MRTEVLLGTILFDSEKEFENLRKNINGQA